MNVVSRIYISKILNLKRMLRYFWKILSKCSISTDSGVCVMNKRQYTNRGGSYFATGNTLVCAWNFEYAKLITSCSTEETFLQDVLVIMKRILENLEEMFFLLLRVEHEQITWNQSFFRISSLYRVNQSIKSLTNKPKTWSKQMLTIHLFLLFCPRSSNI